MYITATELKVNLGKYPMLAETEDIYITHKRKIVAKLTNPYQDIVDVAKSLFGILPNDLTLETAIFPPSTTLSPFINESNFLKNLYLHITIT